MHCWKAQFYSGESTRYAITKLLGICTLYIWAMGGLEGSGTGSEVLRSNWCLPLLVLLYPCHRLCLRFLHRQGQQAAYTYTEPGVCRGQLCCAPSFKGATEHRVKAGISCRATLHFSAVAQLPQFLIDVGSHRFRIY